MGGMLKVPSVPKSKPKPVASIGDGKSANDAKAQAELREKARRGRASTIATSPVGLLTLADWASRRKSLLGE